jgi:hypothetical protein
VWINTEVSDDGRHSVGHTKAYVKVLVPHDPKLVGCEAQVCVRHVARWHVQGDVISSHKIGKVRRQALGRA